MSWVGGETTLYRGIAAERRLFPKVLEPTEKADTEECWEDCWKAWPCESSTHGVLDAALGDLRGSQAIGANSGY